MGNDTFIFPLRWQWSNNQFFALFRRNNFCVSFIQKAVWIVLSLFLCLLLRTQFNDEASQQPKRKTFTMNYSAENCSYHIWESIYIHSYWERKFFSYFINLAYRQLPCWKLSHSSRLLLDDWSSNFTLLSISQMYWTRRTGSTKGKSSTRELYHRSLFPIFLSLRHFVNFCAVFPFFRLCCLWTSLAKRRTDNMKPLVSCSTLDPVVDNCAFSGGLFYYVRDAENIKTAFRMPLFLRSFSTTSLLVLQNACRL